MNNLSLLIVILLAVIPAIAQIIKKASEKAKQEQARRERMRMRDEAMRTGRATAEPTISERQPGLAAQERLRQLEAERQARLRELRERAQRSSSMQTGVAPTGIGAPATPTGRGPSRQARPAPPQTPAFRPAAAHQQRPPRQQRPARLATPGPERRHPAPAPAMIAESPPTAPPAPTERVPKPAPNQPFRRALRDRRSLREAIVLAELLAPPVSLREPEF